MKPSKLLTSVLIISLYVSGCTPKYTASFSKTTPFYTGGNVESSGSPLPEKVVKIQADELIASTEEKVMLNKIPDVKAIVKKYEKRVEEIKRADLEEKKYNKALKVEKKRARKALMKELKDEVKRINKAQQQSEMSPERKIFVGLVIGAAGIVVALLASSAIGGLAIIAGVALIAWGVIEQGGI